MAISEKNETFDREQFRKDLTEALDVIDATYATQVIESDEDKLEYVEYIAQLAKVSRNIAAAALWSYKHI